MDRKHDIPSMLTSDQTLFIYCLFVRVVIFSHENYIFFRSLSPTFDTNTESVNHVRFMDNMII